MKYMLLSTEKYNFFSIPKSREFGLCQSRDSGLRKTSGTRDYNPYLTIWSLIRYGYSRVKQKSFAIMVCVTH